ncbi:four helix bundle protein [Polaribacter filamentus]|uniref:four helix bundle protein n=1 Tax=Polaribacter filamentus TaxID=53483 RepID=UPI00349EBB99
MRNDKKGYFRFYLQIFIKRITYSEFVRSNNRFAISSQVFRSRASIGANNREAKNAESKIDFIQKFKIAAKENDEIEYWL